MLERFTFRDMDSAYSSFLEYSGLQECVILQTCNRVELFGVGNSKDIERIKKTWASVAGLEENTFKENLEISEGTEVFEHLLKLTSGLDSLVVGEEQILGQIKNSINTARELNASGNLQTPRADRTFRSFARRNYRGLPGIAFGRPESTRSVHRLDAGRSGRESHGRFDRPPHRSICVANE